MSRVKLRPRSVLAAGLDPNFSASKSTANKEEFTLYNFGGFRPRFGVTDQRTAAEIAKEKADQEEADRIALAKAQQIQADKQAAADKANADKLAADKLAADKLAAAAAAAAAIEKAAADKLAAEEQQQVEAEKKLAEIVAKNKLAADKLAADKLATDKLAADKLAADKLQRDISEAKLRSDGVPPVVSTTDTPVETKSSAMPWIIGGLLVAAVGVGVYVATRPSASPKTPQPDSKKKTGTK